MGMVLRWVNAYLRLAALNETTEHYTRIGPSIDILTTSSTCVLVVRALGVVEVRYAGPYCNLYPDYPAHQCHEILERCDAIRTWDCFECGAADAPWLARPRGEDGCTAGNGRRGVRELATLEAHDTDAQFTYSDL